MELKRPSMFTIYIGIGIIILVIIIVSIFVGVSKKTVENVDSDMNNIDSIAGEENVLIDEEGNKINTSNNTLSKKEVDGFIFDSFDISTSNGISTITFEIYNPSNEDKKLGEYQLEILDNTNSVIGRITDNVDIVESLSRKEVSLQLKGDIANLNDIRISKIVYKQI